MNIRQTNQKKFYYLLHGYSKAPKEYTYYKHSLDDNNITTIAFIGQNDYTLVPETIDGFPLTILGATTYNMNSSLTSVEIQNNIIEIQ
jgi:hypothetical protein